ncbi:flavodoxin domain-containing protein [bacterium]|nr:flavodoxin domain-containing protein [bacterium]
MEIGLVVYSNTGHTAKLAALLAAELQALGQGVRVIPLVPAGEYSMKELRTPLASSHDVSPFDVIVAATPVHGGRMAAPVRTFLEQTPTLAGKPVAFLLTHFLPYKMGAAQTIEAMTDLSEEAGATVLDSADVTWFSLGRHKKMKNAAVELAKSIQNREINL